MPVSINEKVKRDRPKGIQEGFKSLLRNERDMEKFYIQEIDSVKILKFFMDELSKKYPLAFTEELKLISEGEFHDAQKFFRLSNSNFKITAEAKFYLPGVAIGNMFRSLVRRVGKHYHEFSRDHRIDEELSIECGRPAVKKFMCRMKLGNENEETQIFYAKLARQRDGNIAFSCNAGFWLQ
jgi:hypothetical protein